VVIVIKTCSELLKAAAENVQGDVIELLKTGDSVEVSKKHG
jgi:hypothetical protein